MSDPVAIVARAAARRLEADGRPGTVAGVEAALAAQDTPSPPSQYTDPVAVGGLIVAIASLAWTVYIDLRQRTAKPPAEVVAETVRVTLRDTGQAAAPDRIIDVVVTEAVRTAADQQGTKN